MSEEYQSENRTPRKRHVQLSLLVWLAMIGIDFFLHGGIFAAIYVQDSPFLLSGMEAFRRVPFGYLALLATAGLLVWIIDQTSARGWQKGLVTGLCLGAVMGLSATLGLYSISTASAQLLAAWLGAQVLEIAIAGAIIGQGLLVQSLRRLTFAVIIGFTLLLVGTIVMQSTGLAPSIIMTG
jgi:hypothetical protein